MRFLVVFLASFLLFIGSADAMSGPPPAAHNDTEEAGEAAAESGTPEEVTHDEHGTHSADHPEANHDHGSEAATQSHAHEGEASGGSGHAHWGDHGPRTELEQTIANVGVLHSLAVHFPIALILAAALAQLLVLVTGQASLAQTVRFLAWTGALGGLAAGLLGWAHAGPVATGEAGVMAWHRWIGTGLTLGLFVVAGAAEWYHRQPTAVSRWTLSLFVFAAAATVSINGFLGGALAHGGLRHLLPS